MHYYTIIHETIPVIGAAISVSKVVLLHIEFYGSVIPL